MMMSADPAALDRPPEVIVVLDAVDAPHLAGFWAEVLRYRRVDPVAQYEVLVPPDGHPGSVVLIQAVPEDKAGKNRMHLDLHVTDPDAEIDRLLALGARRVSDGAIGDIRWTTMADPEGNEFCIGSR
jgi:hypothetical protein